MIALPNYQLVVELTPYFTNHRQIEPHLIV